MQKKRVIQSSLSNGLTILVCPKKDAEKVSIQLWYNVGSKHEKSGEKGIAHFIEHMIFKGTTTLTESDINLVVSKLSGSCNAFTSYDYTGYLFDIPVANWDKVLPIMADCMTNCSFKQEHLNSEVKAVIQELKMYKDNYGATLAETMITNLFESHPYHYPIIGYKQDLWSVTRETLLAFYKKHYTPDNAVMIIVGDVNPQDVHQKIEKEFAHIPAGKGWNNETFFLNEDVKRKSIRLFRDIKQPICTISYLVPGIVTKNEFVLESFSYIIANGRGSRLYKLLVDQLQLVVSVHAFVYDLFDKAVLFIEFNPKNAQDIDLIVDHIQREIDSIAQQGPSVKEVKRAERFAQIEYQQMLEDTQKQAYAIGKSFLAIKDPLYPFEYGNIKHDILIQEIQNLATNYLHEVVRNQGEVVAIPESQIAYLNKLQQASDDEDAMILGAKQRETLVEEGSYVHSVILNEKQSFDYSKPGSVKLENGLELLWFHNDAVDIVECQIDLKANHYYDAKSKQGLGNVVSKMLLEGTKQYPGQTFSDEIESYGMSFYIAPGHISTTFLPQDLEKGLSLLTEMLTNASFEELSLDKVKGRIAIQLKKFWDTPSSFSVQLARNIVYKNHPYNQMSLGTQESLAAISLHDCINYYKNMISPQGGQIAIVGNLHNYDVRALVEKTLGQWHGAHIEKLVCPMVAAVEKQDIESYINRDQIVLVFAGLSIDRLHEDYDKILLFDQIFTGGALRSMSSRLFKLREQSGLFYTIGGSLLYGANEQPGMILIKTIVSNDRIEEAEKVILQEINNAIDSIEQDELQEAKNGLINSFDSLYDSNEQRASTFLFLKKYDLPFDYFEKRVDILQKITVAQVQQAVKKILSSDKLIKVKVGRI